MPAWLTSSDWIFYSLACLSAVVATLVLYRALLHDSSRGKRRCPKCWYDMTGIPAARAVGEPGTGSDERWICPECGRVTTEARQLFRTHRYPARAAIGVLLVLLSYAGAVAPKALKSGSMAFVPTTVLMFVAPAVRPPPPGFTIINQPFLIGKAAAPTPPLGSRPSDAMWERVQNASAWDWQARWYLNRVLRANLVELADLYRLPPTWPADWPVPVTGTFKSQPLVAPSAGGLLPDDFRIEVRNQLGAWESVYDTSRYASNACVRSLASPTVGKPFGFEARLTFVRTGIAEPLVVEERLIQPALRITQTIDEALAPIDDPASNELVREALAPRLVRYADGMTIAVNDHLNTLAWKRVTFLGCCRFKLRAGGTLLAEGVIPSWSHFPVWRDWQEKRIEWLPGAEEIVASGAQIQADVSGDTAASFLTYSKDPFNSPYTCSWAGRFTCTVVIGDSPHPADAEPNPRVLNDR